MATSVLDRMGRWSKYALLRKGLNLTQSRRLRRFVEGAKYPCEVQQELLRRIMSENADTEFGKDHGFSQIVDAAAYRQSTPVQGYEDLRPLNREAGTDGEPC